MSCGKGIVQYDHFDPEYVDADDHRADGITLLCGSCHDEKRHGLLTNHQVAEMNADPFCLKHGAAFGQFRLTSEQPIVKLGSSEFRACRVILEVAGEKVLWFSRPSQTEEGFCLNARIRNEEGDIVLEIIKNEWRIGDRLWDVDTSSNGIVIRSRANFFSLILRFIPPQTIRIERADIQHHGTRIRITKDGSIVDTNNNTFGAISVTNCHTGIRFKGPGNIQIGCSRPRSLDVVLKLWLTSALVPVSTLGSPR